MNKCVRPLCDLCVGEWGTVKTIKLCNDMRRRLLDIGLIEGTKAQCVLKSPSGDPSAYLIRGAVIALRREESEKVLVCV